MSSRQNERGFDEAKADRAAWLAIALLAVGLAWLGLGRRYFVHQETDFLGRFVRDARNLLDGRPLEMGGVPGHPPLYAIAISCVYRLVGDWFRTGLLVSFASALACLCAAYRLFRGLLGLWPAWAALAAMAASRLFLHYAVAGGSDMFFMACFFGALACAAHAGKSASARPWLLCGALMGATLLARLNGFTILILALLPWTRQAGAGRRKRAAALALGLCAVVAAWCAFAAWTRSPLLPSGVAESLAVTYYPAPKDFASGETLPQRRFSSVASLLAEDPPRLARRFAADAAAAAARLPSELSVLPLGAVAAAGAGMLLLSAFRSGDRLLLLLLAAAALQAAVVSMKAFESRYFLFLVPWAGACAGALLERLQGAASARWGSRARWALPAAAAAALCWALPLAFAKTRRSLHAGDGEIRQATAHIPAGARVFERGWLVAYYARASNLAVPAAGSLDDLRARLRVESRRVAASEPIYLFYGALERKTRPTLAELAEPRSREPWLELEASSDGPSRWVLYRYQEGPAARLVQSRGY